MGPENGLIASSAILPDSPYLQRPLLIFMPSPVSVFVCLFPEFVSGAEGEQGRAPL